MVYIKRRKMVSTEIITDIECNRCGEIVQGPHATLTLDHSGEFEISHYCESCYDQILAGNKIEPSGHDEGRLMLDGD